MRRLLVGFLIAAAVAAAVRPASVVLTGPDAGVQLAGRPVQFAYVHCLADPAARWYEDGSASCWQKEETDAR
jgi:hypothetical protein